MKRAASASVVLLILVGFEACQESGPATHVSTREDRAALFDYLLGKTLERESFSPVKNLALDLDVEQGMLRYRQELIDAETDEDLYYALAKISNARKDRHLSLGLVEGGLSLQRTAGVERDNYPVPGTQIEHAPIRFAVDYGSEGDYFLFVADYSTDIVALANPGSESSSEHMAPEGGDRLTGINDLTFEQYFEAVEPYHRYSTTNGLWWQTATWLPQRSYQFPPEMYEDRLTLMLERRDGERYTMSLPYMAPETIDWEGNGERVYSGFAHAFATQTYDLYRREHDLPVLLISWHGFRNKDLVADIDRLVEYAGTNGLLDHAIIWDGTRSRGGSKGAYAVQRLSAKPFKTTFGNLRISDVVPLFIEEKRREYGENRVNDSGVAETIDDGSWLMEWLESDVSAAIAAGDDYSNDVPFKLAHAPKDSDGVLQPAQQHFSGGFVCLLGPYGGSHLDQFASIVIDNDLAYVIGMPAGGYSNTWEWEETLVFPIAGTPVVRYMWSIGHTIRANGEVLEGNPAMVHDYVPQTRDNYLTYYDELLSRALQHLGYE